MNKSIFRLPENMSAQARNAFLIATAIALAHVMAVPYYLYVTYSGPASQVAPFQALTAITVGLAILIGIGAALSWYGRPALGMTLVLGILTVTYPPVVTLVSGLGLVLGPALMFVGPMSAFQALPPKSGRVMSFLTGASGAATLLVDLFGSESRPSLPGLFIQLLAAAVIGLLAYLIARQFRNYSLRTKLIIVFILAALIGVVTVGIGTYVSYSNQVREGMRERLVYVINNVTLQQDAELHASIQTVEDQQSDAYKQMQAINAAILTADPDLTAIYSFRVDEQGKLIFVLDNELGYDPVEVGTVYENPSALLAGNALELDHTVVEEGFYTDEYGTFLSAYAPIYRKDGTREGIVGVDISAATILKMEKSARNQILLLALAALLLVVAVGFYLGNLFTKPVVELSATAQRVTEGDLGARANIETADEVGALARTFNAMTSRLQETLGNLEARVAERTRNLELAAEIGRTVSQVRALDVLLKDAVELIRKQFNLYYVQVYLTDASRMNLILQSGTGRVGEQLISRGHRLPLNTGSINGRAAAEKRAVVIIDTAQSGTYLKNPLLPETRGEMAVPLMVADRVVGVLDMQSNEPGVLTEDALPAFEALAGQLAIAIQNANLLAETEQARAQVENQARRLVRGGWSEYLDAIHKPEQIGFLFDHNQVVPLMDMHEPNQPGDEKTIAVPIAVTGEPLGSLVVEFDEETRREQNSELVNAVARQVAQQIENLRLLESAERYRHEAEKNARLQTLEGWREYVNSRSTDRLGYLYDSKEVRPSSNGYADSDALIVPIKARDEQVGRLAIQGLTSGDQEHVELANLVAERLGAHLESLRLTEQIQKRAYELEAVAAVSSTASSTLDPAQLLQSVVNLTKERFGLYHAHVYLLNQAGDTLELAAGAGEVGRQMVAEGWRIPVDHPESIVARVVRQRQSAIANDIVRDAESQFLSNRLLPNTRSELAVPLIVGDKILGVFDVQADTAGRFTEDDIRIQTTLAAQVAVAVQNARSFSQAQKQAERESLLNAINQKIQGATTVEAVLQIAARELGHALGAPLTVAQLGIKHNGNGN